MSFCELQGVVGWGDTVKPKENSKLGIDTATSIMSTYRLDRNSFKAQTAHEAADHAEYYRKLSWKERLRIAAYLNSVAYNYPENQPPRLDKSKFKAVSRKV